MSDDIVHNRIAVLRADRRVSRRELAEALGVHYQTVGYLERGEYAPSLHLALRINPLRTTFWSGAVIAGFEEKIYKL